MKLIGFAFPYQSSTTAFPAVAEDDAVIRASLVQIITTRRGERIMRPDFGCNAFDYVFENDSEMTRATIEREIRGAISRWEPRVSIQQVEIFFGEANEPGQTIVTIHYVVNRTGMATSVTIGAV